MTELLTSLINELGEHTDLGSRHKLIPTRGRFHSRYVYGRETALAEAREQWEETGIPVKVVSHPKGELIKPVADVGVAEEKAAKAKAKADKR